MRKTLHKCSIALAAALTGVLFLGMAPAASAQRIVRQRVVVVAPGPFFYGPFFPYYGYYPYPSAYTAANYGEVKIDTHQKDVSVYIDGGFAAQIRDAKKFTLRPGNHNIELRNPEGQSIYQEQVAVTAGRTVKLHV